MPTTKQTPTQVAEKLARLGSYLDMVEAGLVPCVAQKYQLVARTARLLIAKHEDCPEVNEVVGVSPALQELRSCSAMVKAIHIGLLELPPEVLRALQPQ